MLLCRYCEAWLETLRLIRSIFTWFRHCGARSCTQAATVRTFDAGVDHPIPHVGSPWSDLKCDTSVSSCDCLRNAHDKGFACALPYRPSWWLCMGVNSFPPHLPLSLHNCRNFTPLGKTTFPQYLPSKKKKNICPMPIASGLLTACTVYLVGFCQNTWRWKWDVGRIHLSSYLQNYSHPILVVVLRQTFVRWNIMKTGANVQCAYKYMSVSSTPIQKKNVIVAMIMVVKKKPYFAHNDSICWETPVSTMARRKSTDMFWGTRPARQDDIIVVIGDHQLWY